LLAIEFILLIFFSGDGGSLKMQGRRAFSNKFMHAKAENWFQLLNN
jgi:hypothetical protein